MRTHFTEPYYVENKSESHYNVIYKQ